MVTNKIYPILFITALSLLCIYILNKNYSYEGLLLIKLENVSL